MSRCRHKLGLLSLRDCGGPVEENCTSCGKPVCRVHVIPHETKHLCQECYVALLSEGELEGRRELQSERNRRLFYAYVDYYPFYGRHHYHYGEDDYETFEASDEDFTYDVDDDDEIAIDDFQDS